MEAIANNFDINSTQTFSIIVLVTSSLKNLGGEH